MTYVGIEGSSYVGKTTVGIALEQRGYYVVPEYDAQGPFPASDGSLEGHKAVIDELIFRELRRTEAVSRAAFVGYAFSDRTPISFLTFEDMRMRTARNAEAFALHLAVKDYAVERVDQEVSAGNIVIPDRVAVLRVASEALFRRRVEGRGVTAVEELSNYGVQRYVADRALAYATQYVGPDETCLIDVDEMGAEELADRLVAMAGRDGV